MPCKDANVAYFRQALESVFQQTSPAWELLIINDHSQTEAIVALLDELQRARDKRIRVIQTLGHGIAAALNTGMKCTETPFVCMLHCDDLLATTCIATLTNYITDFPNYDYFHSARQFINDVGKPISKVFSSTKLGDLAEFHHGCPIKHLHSWKVSAAMAIGGMDETLGPHGADDYDFPWCMAEAGYRFKAARECLYYYRDHRSHERLTTHVPLESQIEELQKIFRKHKLSERQIRRQIRNRRAGYLRQALFVDEQDRRTKERDGYDPRQGMREKYQ